MNHVFTTWPRAPRVSGRALPLARFLARRRWSHYRLAASNGSNGAPGAKAWAARGGAWEERGAQARRGQGGARLDGHLGAVREQLLLFVVGVPATELRTAH